MVVGVMGMFRQLSAFRTVSFPQLLKHDTRYKLARISGGSMKDLHIVLSQKNMMWSGFVEKFGRYSR